MAVSEQGLGVTEPLVIQDSSITWQSTLAAAAANLQPFERAVADAPYEAKGVLFSEILFVLAAAGIPSPRKVFESGRAAGVSTFLLSRCFPKTPVVSIELDRNSPDVAIAARNLQGLPNVECLFGDARKLLLAMVEPGDAVVIDGPKHYRALRLAITLLWQRQPRAVFIHDCYLGSPERRFLDAHVPGCLFSDHTDFVEAYRALDTKCWAQITDMRRGGYRIPHLEIQGNTSYGPTFACVPFDGALPFRRLLLRLRITDLIDHWQKSVTKRCARKTR